MSNNKFMKETKLTIIFLNHDELNLQLTVKKVE